jgi:hypothetical protein
VRNELFGDYAILAWSFGLAPSGRIYMQFERRNVGLFSDICRPSVEFTNKNGDARVKPIEEQWVLSVTSKRNNPKFRLRPSKRHSSHLLISKCTHPSSE